MSSTMAGNRLKNVSVAGSPIRNISEMCVKATLKVSTSAVSTMGFTFQDSDTLQLFRSGALKPGTSLGYGGWATTVDEVKVGQGSAGPTVNVTALSKFVTRLKERTGEKSWGNTDVSAWVKAQAKEVGFKPWVQPGLGKKTILRAKPEGSRKESTWDVMTTLARETGVWLFEYGDRLVFAKPTWLLAQPGRNRWALRWDSSSDYSAALAGLPAYTGSLEGRRAERLTVNLVAADADSIRPGDELFLEGRVGAMKGAWVVTDATYPLTVAGVVAVSCERPVNPEKVKAKGTATEKRNAAKGQASAAGGASPASSSGGAAVASAIDDAWLRSWVRAKHGGKWGVEGFGVQCVGLTKQYAKDLYGIWPRGNGRDWYGGSVQGQHFTRIPASAKGQPGDIACWGPPYGKIGGKYYGHVAVVLEDRGSSLYTLTQSGTRGLAAYYSSFGKTGLQGYLRPRGDRHKYNEGVR
ncbi:CHAP domain-containing protein [Paeniglutamicibacter sp. R2-26]|uniref:CHAP domain-containing protein n=1 Tax=Paeniglutamicibacter sp. R2-26 TaxID=3144417 RepID=UPI003EE7BDD9